jgi:hypothetical protein
MMIHGSGRFQPTEKPLPVRNQGLSSILREMRVSQQLHSIQMRRSLPDHLILLIGTKDAAMTDTETKDLDAVILVKDHVLIDVVMILVKDHVLIDVVMILVKDQDATKDVEMTDLLDAMIHVKDLDATRDLDKKTSLCVSLSILIHLQLRRKGKNKIRMQ